MADRVTKTITAPARKSLVSKARRSHHPVIGHIQWCFLSLCSLTSIPLHRYLHPSNLRRGRADNKAAPPSPRQGSERRARSSWWAPRTLQGETAGAAAATRADDRTSRSLRSSASWSGTPSDQQPPGLRKRAVVGRLSPGCANPSGQALHWYGRRPRASL